MFSIRSSFIVAIGIVAIFFSMCFNKRKPVATTSDAPSVSWIPIDEKDWSAYKNVPNYHFARARDYLRKGDYSNASDELKRGNSFLFLQNYRLSAITKQIKNLSDSVAAGKNKDMNRLDAATAAAIKIIDDRYAMVPILVKTTSALNIDNSYTMAPVAIKADSVFDEEYRYLFNDAKSKLRENDRAGAASEIRKAGSFLRLKAVYHGQTARTELDSVENELNELSEKVESGAVNDVAEVDRVFKHAQRISGNKKE